MVIERVLDDIARTLKVDALDVRRANFYGVKTATSRITEQPVEDNVIHDIVRSSRAAADHRARRQR